jgi:hypothetical protein
MRRVLRPELVTALVVLLGGAWELRRLVSSEDYERFLGAMTQKMAAQKIQ